MQKTIYVAGGCFWGVEAYFQQLKGVVQTRVGYAQGNMDNPTYADVCTGMSGFTETVRIVYDDVVLSLSTLLEHMFRFVDPTSLNKQGNDIGTQYRAGIYYTDVIDVPVIEAFLTQKQAQYEKQFVIEVEKLRNFFEAEAEHQDYLLKNPSGYCHVNLALITADEKK